MGTTRSKTKREVIKIESKKTKGFYTVADVLDFAKELDAALEDGEILPTDEVIPIRSSNSASENCGKSWLEVTAIFVDGKKYDANLPTTP